MAGVGVSFLQRAGPSSPPLAAQTSTHDVSVLAASQLTITLEAEAAPISNWLLELRRRSRVAELAPETAPLPAEQ
jgi:hypothetical protein